MKTFLVLLAFLLGQPPLTRALASGTLWEDRFHQPAGSSLAGQVSDAGTRWEAVGPAGAGITVQAGNLAVPGLTPPAGNRVRLTGVNGPGVRVALGSNVLAGTLHYSLALRVADLGALGPQGGVLAAFNNATGSSQTLPAPLGVRLLTRSSGAGYQLGLSKSSTNGADYAWAAPTFTTNDVVFIVAAYEFKEGAAGTASLWINPPASTFGQSNAPPPVLTTSAGADLPSLQSFVLLQRPSPIQPATVFLDDVRVGQGWAGVTPSPLGQLCTEFVQGLPPGTLATGTTPPFVADGALHLTDALNEQANYWIAPFPRQTVQAISAHWKTLIGGGGENSASAKAPLRRNQFVATTLEVTPTGTATSVQLNFRLPTGAVLQSVTGDRGACAVQGSNVTCSVSTLPPGQSFHVQTVLGFDPQLAEQSAEEFIDWDLLWSLSAAEIDPVPDNNAARFQVTIRPNPIAIFAGLEHVAGGGYGLGPLIDRDVDCQPDDSLVGLADEDGVCFTPPPPWLPGTAVTPTVFVTRPAAMAARLDAWLDADAVPGFDPADRIYTGFLLPAFTVPAAAPAGSAWLRFRMSQAGVVGPDGYAPDGEVEDYAVTIAPRPALPDVGIALRDWPASAALGSTISHSVVVSNTSSVLATGVQFVVTYSGELTLGPVVMMTQGSYEVGGQEVRGQVGTLTLSDGFTVH